MLEFIKFILPFVFIISIEDFIWNSNSFLLILNLNLELNPILKTAIKVTTCLVILILIRGCIPRYRYDFLTKMGWIKFLCFMLVIYWLSTILFLIW